MNNLILAAKAAPAPDGLAQFLPLLSLVAMFGILYFLLIRPQRKRQQERQSMISKLKKGDKVITIGGLHGTISDISDDTVVLKVNDVTKLTFNRGAIESVEPAPAAAESK